MSRGSYIHGGSYNQGFLRLEFLDLGVLMFRGSNIQGFPRSKDSRVHVTYRGLTFRVLRCRGLTSRGCYIQGSSTLILCLWC